MAALPPKDLRKPLYEPVRPHQPLNRGKSPIVAARKEEERRVRMIVDPPRKENQTVSEQYAAARNRLKHVLPEAPLTREMKLATPHDLSVQYWKQRMTAHEAAVARHREQQHMPSYPPSQGGATGSAAVSRTNSNGSRQSSEPFAQEPHDSSRPRSVTPRAAGAGVTPRSLVSGGARTPSPQANKPVARVRPSSPSHTSDFVASTLRPANQRAHSNEPFDGSKPPSSPAVSAPSRSGTPPVVRMTRTQLLRGRSPTARDPATAAPKAAVGATASSSSRPRDDSPTTRATSTGSRTSPLPSWCSSVVVAARPRTEGAIPAVRSSVTSSSPNAVLRRGSPTPTVTRTPSPGSMKIKAPGMNSALGRVLASGNAAAPVVKPTSTLASSSSRPSSGATAATSTAAARRLAAATAAVAVSRPTTAVPPIGSAAAAAAAAVVTRTESTVSVTQNPPLRARV